MKKIRIAVLVCFLALCLNACQSTGTTPMETVSTERSIRLYYINKNMTRVVSENYQPENTEAEALLAELLSALANDPENMDYKKPLLPEVRILSASIEKKQINLNFDSAYSLIPRLTEILNRAAIVRTLTQIEGIETVAFFINEQPLMDALNQPVGQMRASDFIDDLGGDINDYERTVLTLYFANEQGDKLIECKQDLMYNNTVSMERLVMDQLRCELKNGVQTLQYQINTLMTTNGQSPFVTLFLVLREDDPYMEENAAIIREILSQRLEGIKNEKGVYITPAFPKLVYVLDECNNLTGGKYDYLTELAVKCSAKRMYPDYISAKKMKEHYEGNVFSPMGCRSFLAPWKDENGNYKFEGRFNQGVVSINLPQIGILSGQDEDKFWPLLEERLALCFEALMCRHNALKGIRSDVSPIHWQYGAVARLDKGETIDELLYGGYSSISLGYIGLYEVTKLVKGCSQTEPEGEDFALRLMNHLRATTDRWRKETNIGFALYGTPAESLCYRFARIDKERFGTIPDVTDKGYYTNSYHVDVREDIDAFAKFTFESQFQKISSGGCISYVEIPNMRHNLEALKDVVRFIYDNIQYAEFNTKSDYCQCCGYDGEIEINEDFQWECPVCHNRDQSKMNVTRRTCGYLGENFWNVGKTKEIKARVLHL